MPIDCENLQNRLRKLCPGCKWNVASNDTDLAVTADFETYKNIVNWDCSWTIEELLIRIKAMDASIVEIVLSRFIDELMRTLARRTL